MPSAIAQTNIFPGAAIAQDKDTASLASPTLQATHIVTLGAATKGIVSMLAIGNVTLDNWSLATGSPNLTPGATYFVASGGRLATSGAQAIGIATSPKTLSVSIQNNQNISTSAASIAALAAQVAALSASVSAIQNGISSRYSGSASIASGVNSGSVTGLSLGFTPRRVQPSVSIPSGGLLIGVNAVNSTLTTSGFDFVLDALTDSANYILDYTIT